MSSLASIEKIVEIKEHPNADKLELVTVLSYQMVVAKNTFKQGELVVFIQPDSVLPDNGKWDFYKSKSSRVRSCKLRGSFSFGICEKIEKYLEPGNWKEGQDITEILGVKKYENPENKEQEQEKPVYFESKLKGKLKKIYWLTIGKRIHDYQKKNKINGFSGLGVCKTDEARYQNFKKEFGRDIPFGEIVDVSLKFEGSSSSFLIKKSDKKLYEFWKPKYHFNILGRSVCHGENANNNYSEAFKKYDIKKKLIEYREKHGVDICIRGELYGNKIQNFQINWMKDLPLSWAMFSVWLVDEKRYANKGEKHYFVNVAKEMGLPHVDILEENVVLTPELIKKYAEDLKEINGKPFEGIVIKGNSFTLKCINLLYDSQK